MTHDGPTPVPKCCREWLIAAAIGTSLALVGVFAVAWVESHRFPPPPTAEEEAHEWGTPRPAPEADPPEQELLDPALDDVDPEDRDTKDVDPDDKDTRDIDSDERDNDSET